MPKNTAMGIVIAAFVFLFGFGIIWHMWWLVVFGLCGALAGIITRGFAEHTEEVIPASEVARTEAALHPSYDRSGVVLSGL